MEELSIEEKAEAYDKALKKAKSWYIDAQIDFKKSLENLFPELTESEEERIRKWIIDDIRFNMNNEPLNNSEYRKKAEKAIAWLENMAKSPQLGEQTPVWSEEDEEHIKRIIEHFEGRKKVLRTQWVEELYNKEIAWLKSLKQRIGG